MINAEERIAALELEIKRVRDLIDRDRTGLARALVTALGIAESFGWIPAGEWGCYGWDEKTEEAIRSEVRNCLDEIIKVAKDALHESGRRAFIAFHPDLAKGKQ